MHISVAFIINAGQVVYIQDSSENMQNGLKPAMLTYSNIRQRLSIDGGVYIARFYSCVLRVFICVECMWFFY